MVQEVDDPCDLPEYCTEGTEVPYPGNCTYYNLCVNGIEWEAMPCPEGTCFDANKTQCDLSPCECYPACPVYNGTTTESVTEFLTPGEIVYILEVDAT
jgi:hypothetical protein